MSIHFILGKPGGGKSRWAAEKLIEQLTDTERVVFTNLPINLPNLNAYLQKHCKKSIDLFARLVELTDDQTGEFWTYRPPGPTMLEPGEFHRIKRLSKEEWSAGKKPDYSGVKDSGVCYMIDEVHNNFNARSWMDTGRDVLYYNSQHRHLGDIVYFITQDLELVDKQFRFLAQDYTTCTNMSKIKVSFWKMPSVFIWKLRVSPAENSPVCETGTYNLDKDGIASTYYTTRLVKGGKADMLEKRKGIPWWVGLAILAIVLIGLFFVIPQLVIKSVGSAVTPKVFPPQIQDTNQTQMLLHSNNVQQVNEPEPATNGLHCLGYTVLPEKKKIIAFLSDGTMTTEIDRIKGNQIIINQKVYEIKRVNRTNEVKLAKQTWENYIPAIQPTRKTEFTIKTSDGRIVGRAVNNRDASVDVESDRIQGNSLHGNILRTDVGGLRDNERTATSD